MKRKNKRTVRQWFRQLFCVHPCFEDEKYYGLYGGSYVYQCPVCEAYVAHYAPLGRTFQISKECYEYYIAKMQEREPDGRKAD